MKLDGHGNFARIRMMARILILLAMLHAFSCAAIGDNDDHDHHDSFTQNEGTECKTKDGESGICRQIEDCDLYVDRLRNKTLNYQSMVHCSSITTVICCPLDEPFEPRNKRSTTKTTSPVNNERPSQTACREWKSLDEAKPGAHMGALIQSVQSDGKSQFVVRCGGSLINKRHVLTAAHCVSDPFMLPKLVRFGADKSGESSPVDVEIQDIIIYPEYSSPIKYHDIAIIRLVRDVEFSPYVRPACLYSDTADVDPSKQLRTLGWDRTGDYSNNLLMKNVTTDPLSNCNQTHLENGVSFSLKNGLGSGQYCAVDKNIENDACEEDSGGPLQLVENGETKIVGIGSFGASCVTAFPAVYTRVASYLDWIESVVFSNKSG